MITVNDIYASFRADWSVIIKRDIPDEKERCDIIEYIYQYKFAKKKGEPLPSKDKLSPTCLRALETIGGDAELDNAVEEDVI